MTYKDYEVRFVSESWDSILVLDIKSLVLDTKKSFLLAKSQLKNFSENTCSAGDRIVITVSSQMAREVGLCWTEGMQ